MKIPKYSLMILSGLFALNGTALEAQSVTLKRTGNYRQTSPTTLTQPTNNPFVFEAHLRGGTNNMSAWGPAFYKPGSGGIPATGTSTVTNTGTLNFAASPNNGTDYEFLHMFPSDGALKSVYPTAPTDGGQYGIEFLGATPPTPNEFTAGLVFSSGTYPDEAPRVASTNNGAMWSSGRLVVSPTGVTTLTLNAFPEYATAANGALVTAGLWRSSTGELVNSASIGGYRSPSLGVNQTMPTSIPINGADLIPGVPYTLEIQYAVFGGPLANGTLNGSSFVGSAGFYKVTRIIVQAGGGPTPDFDLNGTTDLIWRQPSTGRVVRWQMNGTSRVSYTDVATEPTWTVVANGDFNADGQSDLIWRNPSTGRVIAWLMNGGERISYIDITTEPNWEVVGSGDFNSDGRSDLIWRQPSTGRVIVWLMNGTFRISYTDLATEPQWEVKGTGDFNADGQSDIIWRNVWTGRVIVWLMSGTNRLSYVEIATEPQWDVKGTGDFNSDGKSDLIWRHVSSGRVLVWLMDGTSRTSYVDIATEPEWTIVNQ